jgi:hypothetical protein
MSRRAWTQLLDATRQGAGPSLPRPVVPARRAPTPVRIGLVERRPPAVQVVDMTLMGKPRMTRRDRWEKRECVLRYRAQCDELRLRGIVLPETYLLVCFLPMPRSWPAARRAAMDGQPHQQKPDRDNIDKALMDGLCRRDERLHDARVVKRWGQHGRFVLADLAQFAGTADQLIETHRPRQK